MTTQQRNSVTMLTALRAYLRAHPSKINSIPALVVALGEVDEIIELLLAAADRQGTVAEGTTPRKLDAQNVMCAQLNPIRASLFSFAGRTNNHEARAIAGTSESAFHDLRDSEQAERAGQILEAAQACLPAIESHNVTQAALDRLRDSIATFIAAIEHRDTSLSKRHGSRTSIEELLEKCMRIVRDDLDSLIEWFRASDTEFYNGYLAARVIKAYAAHRAAESEPAAATPKSGE